MEQSKIIAVLKPHFPLLISSVRHAHEDFEAWIPEGERLTVEPARAKVVHCRTLYHLEKTFGRSGSPRVVETNSLTYLLCESNDDFDVGVRVKKLGTSYMSYQLGTVQQDELRRNCSFFWEKRDCAHLFLGYRLSSGLMPWIKEIVLTCEGRFSVEWKHVLWTPEEGIQPIQQTSLLPPSPPAPTVRRRDRASGSGEDKRTG